MFCTAKLIILFKSTKLFVRFVIILSGQTGRGKHQRGKTQKSRRKNKQQEENKERKMQKCKIAVA